MKRTIDKTKEVKKKEEVKQEFKLLECIVLWKKKSKAALDYLSGKLVTGDPVVAFYNTNKKNPKEPDIRVYDIIEDGKQGNEIISLWETISKNETRYLTGSTNEKEKLVGFYAKEENEKRPYIRVYFREETDDKPF